MNTFNNMVVGGRIQLRNYIHKASVLLIANDECMSEDEIREYIKDELGVINNKILKYTISYLTNNDLMEQIGDRYRIINENIKQ